LKNENNSPHQQSASIGFENKLLRGLLLPLPTPFAPDQSLELSALKRNIEKWNDTSVAGYVMLGSTGERVHLEEHEYLQVIVAAREVVPADRAFLVGAGQQSTRVTINEVKKAAAAGADAVLVITPHFYRSAITQPALIDHYTAVADAAPVPVILYSMPALTGIKIEPDTVARLSEHKNIIGVKDSSADIEGFKRTIELVHGIAAGGPDVAHGLVTDSTRRDDFAILTGNGTVLYGALCAGADGAILAVGCAAPQLCIEIFGAFGSGENERTALLQEKLTALAHAVTTRYGIGGLKAALDMVGYVGGAVRAPLRPANEEARREIANLLEAAHAVDYSFDASTSVSV
jgi:4-hydroxy-2-oxoglutarate aldolase